MLHRLRHRGDDRRGVRRLAHQAAAGVVLRNLRHRASHVHVDDVGAHPLDDLGGVGHLLRIAAEDLNRDRPFFLGELGVLERPVDAADQPFGAHHLGDDETAAAVPLDEAAEGRVGHAGHRRDRERRRECDGADLHRSGPAFERLQYRSAMGSFTARRLVLWLPPVLYMAAIFHLSAEPNPLPTITEHVWDKILHFVEYRRPGFPVMSRAGRGRTRPAGSDRDRCGHREPLRGERRMAPGVRAEPELRRSRLDSGFDRRAPGRRHIRHRQYGFTSAASTSTLTAWPIRSTDSTSRARGASLRISRPTTPRSGPCTTSTIIPS